MNPFRFRDEMNAQQLIDCESTDCFILLIKEKEALDRYER